MRIDHLWHNLFQSCVVIFYQMEDVEIDNEVHMFCLHYVFLASSWQVGTITHSPAWIKALKFKPSVPMPVLWAWNKYACITLRLHTIVQLLSGHCTRAQWLSRALQVSTRALTTIRDRRSQRAKEKTVVCFVKCAPITDVVSWHICWRTCQKHLLCLLLTKNVKPNQGKQIIPYLLNETWVKIQEILMNNYPYDTFVWVSKQSCCR